MKSSEKSFKRVYNASIAFGLGVVGVTTGVYTEAAGMIGGTPGYIAGAVGAGAFIGLAAKTFKGRYNPAIVGILAGATLLGVQGAKAIRAYSPHQEIAQEEVYNQSTPSRQGGLGMVDGKELYLPRSTHSNTLSREAGTHNQSLEETVTSK